MPTQTQSVSRATRSNHGAASTPVPNCLMNSLETSMRASRSGPTPCMRSMVERTAMLLEDWLEVEQRVLNAD